MGKNWDKIKLNTSAEGTVEEITKHLNSIIESINNPIEFNPNYGGINMSIIDDTGESGIATISKTK